jgi:M6 family metalloprotease-like protein
MAPDISYRITVKTNYITLKNNVIFILTAAWFFAILCMVLSARGDVPHPGLLKKIERGEIEVPYFLKHQVQLLQEGVNSPDNLPDGSRSYGPGKIPESTFSAIAILIDFSDNVAQVDPTYFDNLLYGTGTGTVRHYYNEVTYGNLTIVTVHLPGSLGWQRAPQTYAYYVNNNNGFGSYPQNAQKLTEDAVALADPLVDFSQYDNDHDGYVDALFVIHAGPGAEFTGSNSDIWSHKWATRTPQLVDGVRVYTYSMEPEYWKNPGDMTCGVYAHEMGHAVFGLPDVYDRDGSSRGLGCWSLMAGGSWNGPLGSSPAHPDAWCRTQMGYVTPVNITRDSMDCDIPNIENNTMIYRLWKEGTQGSQYFLAENREKTGYDAALPGAGLCIYHVDESVGTQNDNEWYPGHTSSGHYLVALEQADGNWNLEKNVDSGTAGDPFPGTTNKTFLDSITVPDTKDYNFQTTRVAVRNISPSGAVMQADFEVGVPPADPDIQVLPDSLLFTLSENDTSSHLVGISNFGGMPLNWSISESNLVSRARIYREADWLSENPASGTVAPGESDTVRVTVNTAGLSSGAYSCDLLISSNDSDNSSVIVPVTLNVLPAVVNEPPHAEDDSVEVPEDTPILIPVLVNDEDPDGNLDVFSLQVVSDPGNGTVEVDNTSGEILYAPVQDYFGSDQFSYTVDDDSGATSNVAVVRITVQPVNDPPLLEGIPDVRFAEDGQYSLPLNPYVSDIDGDTLHIQFTAQITGAENSRAKNNFPSLLIGLEDLNITIDPQSHVAVLTASGDSSGIFQVVFIAVDDSGASDTDTVQITVDAVNDVPQISGLPDMRIAEDETLTVSHDYWYQFVNDTETPDDQLQYSLLCGSYLTMNAGANDVEVYAAENWFGRDTLWLVVNDGTDADTARFYLDVDPRNDPPRISGLPDTLHLTADSSSFLPVWEYVSDVESPDSMLQYLFTPEDAALLLSFEESSGRLTISVQPGWSGMAAVYMTVEDDSGAADRDTFRVFVDAIVSTSVAAPGNLPDHFFLAQNYPNPFNPSTSIRFGLQHAARVVIEIYNIRGQRMDVMVNKQMEAGVHEVRWNAGQLASGIYVYRISASRTGSAGESFVRMKKMILLK